METLETNVIIRCLKFNGYKIELDTNTLGKPVARLSKLITVGKNKGYYKHIEGFYFKDEERRKEWISDKMFTIKSRKILAQKDKEEKAAIRQNMQHDFKVGQIYYDSWGYEQTNVDFYQILEVREKSVVIQEIGYKHVGSEGYSSMAAMVAPAPENKIGEPFLKTIQFYLNNDKKPVYYIKSKQSKHGWVSLYTASDKGVYCSWYA